ncbi:MAG TPA: PhzF family phenazine biosynthesis protein [Paludibaculum sp.]|jgi:PhzF family phenazine biosynthesis protein
MELPIYQVDAFASRVFTGNPAAICPLQAWLPDATMQAIAMENNLAETAFFVKTATGYHLRWFTPATEVDLCGHATLASAHVIFQLLEPALASVRFETLSGPLTVTRQDDLLTLDFPARPPQPATPCAGLLEALGGHPEAVLAARDYMIVYGSEAEVRALQPDMMGLLDIDRFAVIVTAPATTPDVDFVSRFFAPAKGVPEDPVTGSAHCTLVPYWAQRLGKDRLTALQVSPRGGELLCEWQGDRVTMAGRGVLYLRGTIEI